MSLQDKLDALKHKFEASTPAEVLAIMHGATDELRNSGIAARVLKEGDSVPDFSLPNIAGELVRPWDLLSEGPVVLSFYRGIW